MPNPQGKTLERRIYQRTKPRLDLNFKFYAHIHAFKCKSPLRFVIIYVTRIYAKNSFANHIIYNFREDFVDLYLRVIRLNMHKWAYLGAFYDLHVNKKLPYVGNPRWKRGGEEYLTQYSRQRTSCAASIYLTSKPNPDCSVFHLLIVPCAQQTLHRAGRKFKH